ncbi:phosphopantetheine-binding protein [Micromonospora sp. RL09-050-HVF-A]|uniref:phosphotransferase family protein n=1 Tax=unclassified Micromonospora TaxID=2617518 RepID=UPI0035ABDA4A
MNAERFVADPRRAGARRYRTGDRARWRHDGTLEFLGRLDDQVKIRGFRVEPAEVHAALVTDERIADAAVTVVRNDDGDRQLVAYLVAATDDLDVRQIRGRLEETLPRYLQPAFLVPVPGLPLTRHGKVDFARLPDPRVGFEPTVDEYVAPTTDLERQLAAIWCQVLKADRVGIDDDFFELGGDSIISIQIVARARRAGVRVSPRDILDARTIRRLAAQGVGKQLEAVPEVAAVTGEPFRLSPIQRWFLEQPLPAREHFNMSQLFELDAHVDLDLLRQALAALVEHHDALRLRLVGPPDAPAQQYGDETAVDLVRLDLSGRPEAEQWGRLEQHAARLQHQMQAAMSSASSLGLTVRNGAVLHNSNALTLRLEPCAVLARVAPAANQCAQLEVDVARRLAEVGSPVAALESLEVFIRGDYVVTFWIYYEPATTQSLSNAEYVGALERLHAGMRKVDLPVPHFTDRVSAAQTLVADHARTPELVDSDRVFLASTLDRMRRAVSERGRPEQLLHGEPHPGNLLSTRTGPLFIDFETCCRGPVEFDLAYAPDDVGDNYPGVDRRLLRDCRILMLAMITTWRWDRGDQFPDGHRLGVEWLSELRHAVAQSG